MIPSLAVKWTIKKDKRHQVQSQASSVEAVSDSQEDDYQDDKSEDSLTVIKDCMMEFRLATILCSCANNSAISFVTDPILLISVQFNTAILLI